MCIVAALAFVERRWLGVDIHETADLAANSIIIQDLRSFDLFVGNYSRVGFHHPGPAILMSLFAGELLFYDLVGCVRSPLAGQLLGVAMYTAAWLSIAGWLMARLWRSRVAAVAMASATVMMLAYSAHQSFVGPWFPHLYLFPYLTFVIGVIGVTLGRSLSIVPTAIACGFLVHGHVSFVAICGISIVGALVANAWISSDPTNETERILTRVYANRHRTAFVATLAVFALFVAPIIIETVRHYPGEVVKYVSYTGGNDSNSLIAALRYVGRFWGGGSAAVPVVGFAALVASWPATSNLPDARTRRAVIITLIVATIALVFYAKVGVDDLGYEYIGHFYRVVPALAVGLVATRLDELGSPWTRKMLAIVTALLAIVITYRQLQKRSEIEALYDEPRAVDALEDMQAFASRNGPFVLDLNMSPSWEETWAQTLAIQAVARRRGERPFCIGENWHVSNSEQIRCTSSDLANRVHVRGIAIDGDFLPPSDEITRTSGVVYFSSSPPVLGTNWSIDVADPADRATLSFVLESGWSFVEEAHVWSVAREATIWFVGSTAPESTDSVAAEVELLAYLPQASSEQDVEIAIESIVLARAHFDSEHTLRTVRFDVPRTAIGPNRTTTIVIRSAWVVSPSSSGHSSDPRELGVALRAFRSVPRS